MVSFKETDANIEEIQKQLDVVLEMLKSPIDDTDRPAIAVRVECALDAADIVRGDLRVLTDEIERWVL
jgi:hypothetical protein